MLLKSFIKLMRPKQWIKNAFVLAPFIFSNVLEQIEDWGMLLATFVLFCVAASMVYIFNDIHDLDYDRRHPTKSKSRPLANGSLSVTSAWVLFLILGVGLVLGLSVWSLALKPILAYLVANVFYTLWLKKQPIMDIMMIAFFFLLRVYAGALAIDVPLSGWMFVTTMSIALFLASVKRRQELLGSGDVGREVLGFYSLAMVDQFITITATCSLIFYGLFVVTIRQRMAITVPFVLFGLFRYLFIMHTRGEGESPTHLLLKDWQLILTVVGWILACMYVIGGF